MMEPCKCYIRKCIHYTGIVRTGDTEESEIYACRAFPKGIPLEILEGTNKHLVKIKQQENDIVFEK